MKKVITLICILIFIFTIANPALAYLNMPRPNIYGPSCYPYPRPRPRPYPAPYYYGRYDNGSSDFLTAAFLLVSLAAIASNNSNNQSTNTYIPQQSSNTQSSTIYVQTEYGLVPLAVYEKFMKK